MKLETENLILYPLTESLIQQILNDEVTDYSTKEWLTEDNRTLLTWMYEELYAFIPPKIGFTSWIFIEKSTNQVIGDGGYKGNPDSRGEIEIGYEIIESKRQKGYATEAIEALLEWTLTQNEVKSIIAKCHCKNIPSQSLLDKLGFKLIGEEDEMDLYQIKLEENSLLNISKYVITGIIAGCLIIPITKVVKHLKKSK
jgi:[ribosomal protein S5]-alanine N-acetyltransferase